MTFPDATPTRGRSLRSTISSSGELRLELAERDVPEPGGSEVVVAVEASPINPSDLGVLLGAYKAVEAFLMFDVLLLAAQCLLALTLLRQWLYASTYRLYLDERLAPARIVGAALTLSALGWIEVRDMRATRSSRSG